MGVARCSAGARSASSSSLPLGVQTVFLAAVPTVVVAAALVRLLEERPLRTTLGPETTVEEGLAEASLVPAATHL